MNKKDFNNISIRGRIAYGIMCFEEYVSTKYPDKDFAPVCTFMWNIVSDKDYIDVSAERYMEIIPEYLYEFDEYEKAGFEFLTFDEFNAMRELVPNNDEALNIIMYRIYDIAMEHACGAITPPAKASIDLLFDIIEQINNCGISLPRAELVDGFDFGESGGWGSPISHVGLSRILS